MGYSSKLIWAGLALAAFFVCVGMTRWGIGISPDSVSYIGGARSLLQGHGFSMPTTGHTFEPMTHHAPFYSILLASVGFLGLDPVDIARWVNGLIFAANILVVCLLIEVCLKDYPLPFRLILPLLGGWLFLTSTGSLEIHAMAWTEALFLLLGFAGLYFLVRYLEGAKTSDLLIASGLISLALLTRYAGIVLPVTGVLAIILFGLTKWKRRIVDALLFGIVSFIPLCGWLVRNWIVAGTATNREIIFHPIGKIQAQQALETISSWALIPGHASGWTKLVTVSIILAVLVVGLLWRPPQRSGLPLLVKTLPVFVLIYAGFLLFSISFLDANTPLDNRILSPVYVSLLILLVIAVGRWIENLAIHLRSKTLLLGVFALLSIAYLLPAARFVYLAYQEGLGFNSKSWRQSETIASLAALPQAIPIYSNAPEAIYIHTNRPADRLPSKFQSANLQINPDYRAELAIMNASLQSEGGVVVYFNNVQRSSLPEAQDLIEALNLRLAHQTKDGLILSP